MKSIYKGLILPLGVLFVWSLVFAYPDTERAPADPSTLTEPPLSFFNDQPDDFVVTSDSQYIFFALGDSITRVDLFSWSTSSDQVPDLDDTSTDTDTADEEGDFKGLAISGSRLYATQDDGDLVIIDLDDITDAEPDVVKISNGELGKIVADPEGTSLDDQLYIADQTNKQIHTFDISDNEVTQTVTLSSGGSDIEPGDLEFVALDDADKIYVATDEGILFVIAEGGTSSSSIDIDSAGGNDLVALATSPNNELLFVLDDTGNLLHIYNTDDNTAVSTSDTPVDLSTANGDLRDIVVASVDNPSDVYAYIAGSEGISIIDLDISTTLNDFRFVDMGSDPDDNDEPFDLAGSRTPQDVLAPLSNYVLTINTDTSVSVISENPFVTITANSLGSDTLTVSGSFTLTFEADAAGTYSVRVGGDLDADGSEVDSGTVSAANTPVTTNTISYSSVFAEGNNDVFVFVTDSSSNQGHDKVVITVDTPPPQVTLRSTGFGNARAYIDFDRLDVSDVTSYNLYAETTSAAVMDASASVRATASQPSATSSTVEGVIPSLTNGQTYFLAVEGVDANGNIGPRNQTLEDGSLAVATPQVTVGITGASGETGCQLVSLPNSSSHAIPSLWILLTGIILLVFLRILDGRVARGILFQCLCRGNPPWLPVKRAATGGRPYIGRRRRQDPSRYVISIFFFLFLIGGLQEAFAEEASPQWWSFEFKIGELIPIDNTTDDFLTTCCNERFEIEFGFLYDSKYGFEVGVGFLNEGRRAIGTATGETSQDRFNFTIIPIQNNLTFRADFKENQRIVPYVKFGPDYWYFRENLRGNVTKGIKYGIHGTVGVQILMEFGDEGSDMELEWGVNDVYLTLEGEYDYVNSFGSNGLDLSGWLISMGVLFEF